MVNLKILLTIGLIGAFVAIGGLPITKRALTEAKMLKETIKPTKPTDNSKKVNET